MIVFDLVCRECRQGCESWFASNADYEAQKEAGQLTCPSCQSDALAKAPMAPAIPRKQSQSAFNRLAEIQSDILSRSRWVGDRFVEVARAMHLGERESEPIHGQATMQDAVDLIDEGLPVCPLPLPLVPPGQVN